MIFCAKFLELLLIFVQMHLNFYFTDWEVDLKKGPFCAENFVLLCFSVMFLLLVEV